MLKVTRRLSRAFSSMPSNALSLFGVHRLKAVCKGSLQTRLKRPLLFGGCGFKAYFRVKIGLFFERQKFKQAFNSF